MDYSSNADDLKLQRLDNDIFYGSCEILAQPILLQYENIKFIIGVNLSTENIASYYTQYFQNTNSLMVNICSPITANVTTEPTMDLYIQKNTILLQKLVGQYLQMGKKMKISSAQTRIEVIQSLPQFCNSNVLSCEPPLIQYQAFNDLLALFESFRNFGNILVVSSQPDDSILIKFLISRMATYYTSVPIQDSLQYMKAILNLSISSSHELEILNDKELREYCQTQKFSKHKRTSSFKRRCGTLPESSTTDSKVLMDPIKRGRF